MEQWLHVLYVPAHLVVSMLSVSQSHCLIMVTWAENTVGCITYCTWKYVYGSTEKTEDNVAHDKKPNTHVINVIERVH